MGHFGLTAGHTDEGDDAGGLTCIISNSRIPNDYESGRFHFLVWECTQLSSQRQLLFLVALVDMVKPHP